MDDRKARNWSPRSEGWVGYRTQRRLLRAGEILLLLLMAVYVVFPIYWMVVSSLKTPTELFPPPGGSLTLVPRNPTFESYVGLWTGSRFPRQLLNSSIVAIGSTFLTVVLATLGGYGLARTEFYGKRPLSMLLFMTYLVPHLVLGIPLYLVFYRTGLLNTHLGVILAHTSITLPLSMWVMWKFILSLPIALEESAWVSGSGRLRTLWEIVIPLVVPGITAIGIYTFAVSWSEYTLALVLLTDPEMYTFSMGLWNPGTRQSYASFAGAVLVMLPLFVIVFPFQKFLLSGLDDYLR